MAPASTSGGNTTRICQPNQHSTAITTATPSSDHAARPATAKRSNIGATVPDRSGPTLGIVPDPSPHDSTLGMVPKLILYGIVAIIVLTIVGWIIGAILSILRIVAVIVVIGAVVWAVTAARSGD